MTRTSLTVSDLLAVTDNAATLMETFIDAHDRADAVEQLRAIAQLCHTAIGVSHMGTAADTVILELGDESIDYEAIAIDVVTALTARGLFARMEQTGGGVICVFIAEPAPHPPQSEYEWICGTANDTWGGDLVDVNGELVGEAQRESQHITTTVNSRSTDAEAIADALHNAIVFRDRAVRS